MSRLLRFLLIAMLPLAGCVIPVEGNVRRIETIQPAAIPLAPGEKVVLFAHNANQDDDDAIVCLRNRTDDLLPDDALVDVQAFRAIPGVAATIAGGSMQDHMDALAADEALRSRIRSHDIRYVVEAASFRDEHVLTTGGPFENLETTSITTWVLDAQDGSVSGPARVAVGGESYYMYVPFVVIGGQEPVTEGPACRRMATMIASFVTGRPLAEMDPELAAESQELAFERAANETQNQAAIEQHAKALAATRLDDWLRICDAAVAGDAKQMSRVGSHLKVGYPPVAQDEIEAYTWYRRAVEAGYTVNETHMSQLWAKFTEAQRAEAEARFAAGNRATAWCRTVAEVS